MSLGARNTTGIASIVSVVFLVFGADTLFQTVVPVTLQAEGRLSSSAIGLVMGTALGVGLALSPIAGKLSDHMGRRPLLLPALGGVLAGTALTAFAGPVGLLYVVLAALVYGSGRSSAIVVTLAGVADAPGSQQRVQGLNSSAQRLSAIVAAAAAALVILTRRWDAGYAGIALLFAGAMLVTARTQPVGHRIEAPGGSWYQAVPEAFTMLRSDKRLQASSMLNLTNNALVILGNSFLPLTLAVSARAAATEVITVLACRDLTATGVGLIYPSLGRRVGLRGSIVACTVTGSGGLALFALAGPAHTLLLILGAALQGIALAISIASTNLLATASGSQSGMRLASTMYVSAIGSLLLPVLYGAVLQDAGPRLLYTVGTGTVLAALTLAIWYLRPRPSPLAASTL